MKHHELLEQIRTLTAERDEARQRERALSDDARLAKVLREVADWAWTTFGASTPESKAEHLRREVAELCEDPRNPEEMADCVMILGHLAAGQDVDLAYEIERKLAINRTRTWQPPDANGVVEHDRAREALAVRAACGGGQGVQG